MGFIDISMAERLAVGFGRVAGVNIVSSTDFDLRAERLYEVERLDSTSDVVDTFDMARGHLVRARSAVVKAKSIGTETGRIASVDGRTDRLAAPASVTDADREGF